MSDLSQPVSHAQLADVLDRLGKADVAAGMNWLANPDQPVTRANLASIIK